MDSFIEDERIAKAQAEYEQLVEWAIAEGEKVSAEIRAEPGYILMLDGYNDRYAYIYETMRKRVKEIKEKYHIVSSK